MARATVADRLNHILAEIDVIRSFVAHTGDGRVGGCMLRRAVCCSSSGRKLCPPMEQTRVLSR